MAGSPQVHQGRPAAWVFTAGAVGTISDPEPSRETVYEAGAAGEA